MTKLKFLRGAGLMLSATFMMFLASCTEDEAPAVEDPIASFQFAVNEENFLEVSFTNFSVNADSYAWTFGDGATSTEENPTYAYAEADTYTVTLVASNEEGTSSEFSADVTITDPLAAQRALIGDNGKVWQLVADNSTGVNPLEVGPLDRSAVWFALADVCSRECIFDDTWTFNTDGTFTFDNNGDAFAEGGVFADFNETCFEASAANFVGPNGEDLSAWNSGTHPFNFDANANTLTINGGFIGLMKVGSTSEATTPFESVTYSVTKLVEAEGVADTLVLETQLVGDDGPFGYWQFVLVSYANEADEIVVEECPTSEKTVIDAVSIDFEDGTPTFGTFGGNDDAGGGMSFSVIDNPDTDGNSSTKVGAMTEPDQAVFYAGGSTPLAGYIDLSTKQTFSMKVWSPSAGETIKLKLEDSADPNIAAEVDATTTVAEGWETLTFTFSADDTEKFDVLVVFFDFDPNGDQSRKSGERTHYFDDIVLE